MKQSSNAAPSTSSPSPHRTALIAAVIGALATIVAALITTPWLGVVVKAAGGFDSIIHDGGPRCSG